MELPN